MSSPVFLLIYFSFRLLSGFVFILRYVKCKKVMHFIKETAIFPVLILLKSLPMPLLPEQKSVKKYYLRL